MKVLLDTSVWIEFFRIRPELSKELLQALSELIEQNQIVTIFPIEAETLSGNIHPLHENLIKTTFSLLDHVDLDWNSSFVWREIVNLAVEARKFSLAIPSIIDRMIVLAAQKSNLTLWTLDKALLRLAEKKKVKIYSRNERL